MKAISQLTKKVNPKNKPTFLMFMRGYFIKIKQKNLAAGFILRLLVEGDILANLNYSRVEIAADARRRA